MYGEGKVSMRGELTTKVIRAPKAPLSWRIQNTLRWGFLTGWLFYHLAKLFTRLTGVVTMTGELAIRVRRASGEWINYGVVSYRLITDAAVAYIVDDWDGGANTIDLFNYHGVGTTNTAEAAGDTALAAECTTVLNPDSTRATGTKSQPTANQAR